MGHFRYLFLLPLLLFNLCYSTPVAAENSKAQKHSLELDSFHAKTDGKDSKFLFSNPDVITIEDDGRDPKFSSFSPDHIDSTQHEPFVVSNETWFHVSREDGFDVWLHFDADLPPPGHEVPITPDDGRNIGESFEQALVNHPTGNAPIRHRFHNNQVIAETYFQFEHHEHGWWVPRLFYRTLVEFFSFRRSYHRFRQIFKARVVLVGHHDGRHTNIGLVHENVHFQ